MVMGIINVTPDSFHTQSRVQTETEVKNTVEKFISEGADIIDVGACSTRPGAQNVAADEELYRLSHALETIRKYFPDVILSVDTYRAAVAKTAVNHFNVNIINDISGGDFDPSMFETVGTLSVPYVLTHSPKQFECLHQTADTSEIIAEVLYDLGKKLRILHELGVKDIFIDPGFGFGKTVEQNYTLLRNLEMFSFLHHPLLVGFSRKRMVTEVLNISANEALNGTTYLNSVALEKGAAVLRVHDVAQAAECVKLYSKLYLTKA